MKCLSLNLKIQLLSNSWPMYSKHRSILLDGYSTLRTIVDCCQMTLNRCAYMAHSKAMACVKHHVVYLCAALLSLLAPSNFWHISQFNLSLCELFFRGDLSLFQLHHFSLVIFPFGKFSDWSIVISGGQSISLIILFLMRFFHVS